MMRLDAKNKFSKSFDGVAAFGLLRNRKLMSAFIAPVNPSFLHVWLELIQMKEQIRMKEQISGTDSEQIQM